MNKGKLVILGISALVLFSACWPEDEAMQGNEAKLLPCSFYKYQMYYSLEKDTTVSYNLLNDWDLGFESSPAGNRIIINSGKMLGVVNLGAVGFNSATTVPDGANWVYDASSGNPDSLAIDNWIDTQSNPYVYTNNVYILGISGDFGYEPRKKMQFIGVGQTSYTMLLADLDSRIADTLTIFKNDQVNFTKTSVIDSFEIKNIEPGKDQWDLLFTQYGTILFTDEGIPTPYIVRGVMINPSKVSVARTLVANEYEFYSLGSSVINGYSFATRWDAIGYNWKEVDIDENANSAVYTTNPNKIYLIRLTNNKLFKLRFISFYSKTGEPGYIGFEYYPLQDFE